MLIQVIRETHDTPEFAQRALALAGGINRFGEPNYRIVWGWNRLTFMGGEWKDTTGGQSSIEIRRVPKYDPCDRWHLERWMPPEMYGSPRQWAVDTMVRVGGLLIPGLGPYPDRGEYEQSMVIDQPCDICTALGKSNGCEHRQFVQLTHELVRRLVRAIECSRDLKDSQRREAIRRRQEREERADDYAVEEMMGSDPDPISPQRRAFLDRAIIPALATAMKKSESRRTRPGPQIPRASAGLPSR